MLKRNKKYCLEKNDGILLASVSQELSINGIDECRLKGKELVYFLQVDASGQVNEVLFIVSVCFFCHPLFANQFCCGHVKKNGNVIFRP